MNLLKSMVLISLLGLLVACSDGKSIPITPEMTAYAMLECQHNGGLKYYKVAANNINIHQIYVTCNNGMNKTALWIIEENKAKQ